jgi:signal transduction histidine kinase
MDSRVGKQAPDGTRYENITVYPLVSNWIGGAVIRIDDITENVKIEEMMIQSEKMLSVGGLAAGMAHEINNPLSGIIGNADVLKNRIFNALPVNVETARQSGTTFDVIRTYAHKRDLAPVLDNIKIAATRAATIVSDMLSFSRKSSSSFTAMDIARLMDKTIELAATNYDLKARFDFKQIKITRFYDDIPKIPCEAGKLQQVFLNILTNGAQAMSALKDDSEPEFTITIRKNQTHAIIEIRDNGPGMSKEVAKRIFEPFFTTKEIGVGTGLGLSVSYFIITDHHKGSLKVDSAPGKGAGFTIMLPITLPEK